MRYAVKQVSYHEGGAGRMEELPSHSHVRSPLELDLHSVAAELALVRKHAMKQKIGGRQK